MAAEPNIGRVRCVGTACVDITTLAEAKTAVYGHQLQQLGAYMELACYPFKMTEIPQLISSSVSTKAMSDLILCDWPRKRPPACHGSSIVTPEYAWQGPTDKTHADSLLNLVQLCVRHVV